MTPQTVPDAAFHTQVRDSETCSFSVFEWKTLQSSDLFSGKRVVLFALPGAFTPACSETHLPGYEQHFDEFIKLGIDQVICLAVNDAFVMYEWGRSLGIEKVFLLPDGNGEFSRKMGMLVDRGGQGLAMRSWRYSMYAEDGVIKQMFIEPDFKDNPPGVPVKVSGAETMLDYLQSA